MSKLEKMANILNHRMSKGESPQQYLTDELRLLNQYQNSENAQRMIEDLGKIRAVMCQWNAEENWGKAQMERYDTAHYGLIKVLKEQYL